MLADKTFSLVCCWLLFLLKDTSLQKTDVLRLLCPGDSLLVAPRLSESVLVTWYKHDFEFKSSHPIRGLYQYLPTHHGGPEFKSNLTQGLHLFEFKAVDSIGRSAICVFTVTVEVVTCPTVIAPTFGEIDCDSHSLLYGTRCDIKCPRGYASHGQPIECLENGSWLGHLPHCQMITCADPGIPLHGDRECTSRYLNHNSICRFHCLHGYRLIGDPEMHCTETDGAGHWSHMTPTCKKIIPPIVEKCPKESIHVMTSREEADVLLPSIRFRSSSSGRYLNHTCSHFSGTGRHHVLPVGVHSITCHASEADVTSDEASFRSQCKFTVHVEADPCRPLPQPINGLLLCSRVPHFNHSHELGLLYARVGENRSKYVEQSQQRQHHHRYHKHSTICRMFCRQGYVFPKTFGRHLENKDYKCSRPEGMWRPFSFVPGCVAPKAPSELKLPVEIQFNVVKGDCSMLTTTSQSLLQSQLKSTSVCSQNPKECLVEEWSVHCQRLPARVGGSDNSGYANNRRKRKRRKRYNSTNKSATIDSDSESSHSKKKPNNLRNIGRHRRRMNITNNGTQVVTTFMKISNNYRDDISAHTTTSVSYDSVNDGDDSDDDDNIRDHRHRSFHYHRRRPTNQTPFLNSTAPPFRYNKLSTHLSSQLKPSASSQPLQPQSTSPFQPTTKSPKANDSFSSRAPSSLHFSSAIVIKGKPPKSLALPGRERSGKNRPKRSVRSQTQISSSQTQISSSQTPISSTATTRAVERKRVSASVLTTEEAETINSRLLVRFQLATRLKNGESGEASPKKWASNYHKTVVFLQSMYHALEELLNSGSLNLLQVSTEHKKTESNKSADDMTTKDGSTEVEVTSIAGYAVTAQAEIVPVCDFEYEFNKNYLMCVPCGPETYYDTLTGSCAPCPEGTSQPEQAQFSCY